MDGFQFDAIVRILGVRGQRRRIFQLLGAGVLISGGARGLARPTRAQQAPEPQACVDDTDCTTGDLDPCTGNACVDGLCTYFIVDCMPGHACCGNGACCPTGDSGACLEDADCGPVSDDPCAGARCEGGSCTPFLTACAPDFTCCGNGACCPATRGCFTDANCVGPGAEDRCISGVCVPWSTLPHLRPQT